MYDVDSSDNDMYTCSVRLFVIEASSHRILFILTAIQI